MKHSPLHRINSDSWRISMSSEQPVKTWQLTEKLNSGSWGFYQVTLLRTWSIRTWCLVGQNPDLGVLSSVWTGGKLHCQKKMLTNNIYTWQPKFQALSELEFTRQAASKKSYNSEPKNRLKFIPGPKAPLCQLVCVVGGTLGFGPTWFRFELHQLLTCGL